MVISTRLPDEQGILHLPLSSNLHGFDIGGSDHRRRLGVIAHLDNIVRLAKWMDASVGAAPCSDNAISTTS